MKSWRIQNMPVFETGGEFGLWHAAGGPVIDHSNPSLSVICLYILWFFISQNLNELCAFWVAVGKWNEGATIRLSVIFV